MGRLALFAALVAALAAAAPAGAAERFTSLKGVRAAGPAKYDRVFVQKIGPKDAKRVLVLVPGFFGGAGGIAPVARDIVARVPGLAVWVVDRRENAFEDTSVFESGDAQTAFDYYLNFQYEAVRGADAPFAGKWGLRVALGDLRKVILKARAGGRRDVILGGHSLGASTTVAYAAWDFNGRPGYRDIDAMVLIDGGLRGSFDAADKKRARAVLAEIDGGKVFDDLLGLGLPEINGIFTEVAAQLAYEKPDDPSVLQGYSLLPAAFKAPFRVTNEAALGFAFDATTSPSGFELIRIRAGGLAASGDPRPWQDGELTPISALCEGLGRRAPERDPVVLLQAAAARRGRDERAQGDARDAAARAAPTARQDHRRALVCLRDRSDRRTSGERRALARAAVRHSAVDRGCRSEREPPGSDLGGSLEEPLSEDGGPVPKALG